MRSVNFAILALVACVLVAGRGWGQTGAPADEEGAASTTAAAGEIKPEELLRKMADYVCGLEAFSCRVERSVKMEQGDRQQSSETNAVVRLARPNKLAVAIESGQMGMTIVSDGKELVQYVPSLGRYVVAEAPADFSKWENSETISLGDADRLLPGDAEQFYKQMVEGVTGSEYLGVEKVDNVECHRCKFLQDGMNWEIWIETGERPLPRKFVPDYSQRLGEGMKLDYSVAFSDWNVAEFTEADFRFKPPEGAEQVDSLLEGLAGQDEAPHPLVGKEAPAFETVDLEGNPINLKDYLGKNVIMLDFWATWCGPCVEAMPQIEAVAKKFADRGLVFYGVNVGENIDTVKAFLEDSELEVPVAMDLEGGIAGMYQAPGFPQTVLIGKDGRVQVVHVGFSPRLGDALTKEVEDLLTGKDLAAETLAKAEKATKRRAKPKQRAESEGVTRAWTLPGQWTGVATTAGGDHAYAASDDKIVVVDSTGKVEQEIPTKSGGTLRVANLIDGGPPEFVTFQAWRSGVKALSATGESLWEYPPGGGVDDVWAADVNAEGPDEVIIGFNGDTGLHVLDNRGAPLWKFTEIGNVWHVAAGDFQEDGKTNVVSTSAAGQLHVFDAEGNKLKDVDLSIYGNMVRTAKLADGSTLAIVTGSGDAGETLVGVNYAGQEKFAIVLPSAGVNHVDDMVVATTVPWAAVAMRGGLVNVVDLESGEVIAQAAEQGMTPQVAWLSRKEQTPLLIVVADAALNAFEVTPVLAEDAGDTAAIDAGKPQAEEPADAASAE